MINVDFADVRTVLSNRGEAIMGIGVSSGENRGTEAARMAMENPLIENSSFQNASQSELKSDEIHQLRSQLDLAKSQILKLEDQIVSAADNDDANVPDTPQEIDISSTIPAIAQTSPFNFDSKSVQHSAPIMTTPRFGKTSAIVDEQDSDEPGSLSLSYKISTSQLPTLTLSRELLVESKHIPIEKNILADQAYEHTAKSISNVTIRGLGVMSSLTMKPEEAQNSSLTGYTNWHFGQGIVLDYGKSINKTWSAHLGFGYYNNTNISRFQSTGLYRHSRLSGCHHHKPKSLVLSVGLLRSLIPGEVAVPTG